MIFKYKEDYKMALNNYTGGNNNTNQNQPARPTVYSAISFANPMSPIDATRLSASYWNRMLKLTITPRVQGGNENEINWDKNQHIAIHLTHIKAYMLEKEIERFLMDPEKYNSSGVISNETMITISNGSEFGANGIFLVIRKLNLETMETLSSYTYEFNRDFHYVVRNYDEASRTFEKNTIDYSIVEVEELRMLLQEYVKAATNAVAYTVVDQLDYRLNRNDNNLKQIAGALGVTLGNPGYQNSNPTRRIQSSNTTGLSASGSGANQPKTMTLEEADALFE